VADPTVLSLFSGVGGFDIGFHAAQYRTTFMCEWDRHAIAVLNRHFPDIPKWGDISTLTGRHILSVSESPDVVIWGSPCQDLSVAGRRAGLDGSRSGLFYEGLRIINEIREATSGRYPRVSVWENVVGALNSNRGADFGVILDEMAAAGALVIEWRVLDARYFGVPQRRRRVFVVAVFDPATAGRCPDPLLPVEEGVRGDTAPGAAAREGAASEVAGCLGGSSHRMRGFGDYADDDTASAIKARDWKDATDLVTQPFTSTSHAQYTEGIGTLRANGGDLAGGSETLLVTPITEATMTVRRLTPLECERLMGWPDDWTAGQADSHRYKQCGNGVASPVAEWIARRLRAVLDG
jgi:DNA (cytosine-5)-methyltransferase 1